MSKTPLNIRIKNARKKANLTQKDVYEKLNIAQSTYSSWEIGKAEPDADTITKLCYIFEIAPNDFMEWENESELINFTVTRPEQNHIKKYRVLDEHGKETVDVVLEKEHERIIRLEQERAKKEQAAAKEKAAEPAPAEEEPETVEMKIYWGDAAAGIGNYLIGEGEYDLINFPADEVPSRANFGIRISGDSMEPRIHDGEIVWVMAVPQIENGEIGIFVLNGHSLCKKLHIDYDKGRKTELISLNPDYDDIVIRKNDNLRTIGRVLGKDKWDNWN